MPDGVSLMRLDRDAQSGHHDTEDLQRAVAAISDLAAWELGHLATQPDGDTT
jgi:hypothetical protein